MSQNQSQNRFEPAITVQVDLTGIHVKSSIKDAAEQVAIADFLRALARPLAELNLTARAYGRGVRETDEQSASDSTLPE